MSSDTADTQADYNRLATESFDALVRLSRKRAERKNAGKECPAFEIVESDGRIISIFSDGSAEGIDPESVIFNRIDAIVREAYARGIEYGRKTPAT